MEIPRPRRYRSYVVRCWHGVDADEARYIVETVSNTPQQRGFRTLDELLRFLRDELVEPWPAPDGPAGGSDA
jgi:hypothetical protein